MPPPGHWLIFYADIAIDTLTPALIFRFLLSLLFRHDITPVYMLRRLPPAYAMPLPMLFMLREVPMMPLLMPPSHHTFHVYVLFTRPFSFIL